MHAFDEDGIHYGAHGQLTRSIIDKHSLAGYKRLTSCLSEDYNRFCYPQLGTCINGKRVQSEALADLVGKVATFAMSVLVLISQAYNRPIMRCSPQCPMIRIHTRGLRSINTTGPPLTMHLVSVLQGSVLQGTFRFPFTT